MTKPKKHPQIKVVDLKRKAPTAPPTSVELLAEAQEIQEDRAKQYDQPGGERSMDRTVRAFNIITRRENTDRELRESDGWLLMQLLKDVRDQTTEVPHTDSIKDKVSYSSLQGEARLAGN